MRAYQAQVARNWQEIAERNLAADLAVAKALRESALAHGTLDQVADIICPPVQRKRGRQWGSHSKAMAARREALWRAYQEQKAKSPEATDKEIAAGLFARDRRAYGHSATAVTAHIAKLKSEKADLRSLLEKAGRPRKRGRPKKTAKTD